jgi:hypothetical protein
MLVDRATNNKYAPIIIGVAVVGGVLLTYFLGRKLLETVGIVDTKYDRRLRYLNGFDPNYYKTNMSKVTISTAQAQKIADDVYYSYGFAPSSGSGNWATTAVGGILNQSGSTQSTSAGRGTFYGNDDEEKLYNAIKSSGSQYNLSKVSDTFQKKYGVDMAEYIMSFADNSDTEAIYKTIKDW